MIRDFSPLFIGEVSSTAPAVGRSAVGRSFQSPLHRGGLFNSKGEVAGLNAGAISVPSSSGRSLQRNKNSRYNRAAAYFSPLFIGEVSSTRAVARSSSRVDSFQSPLHRGGLFNRGPRPRIRYSGHISVPSSSGRSLQPRLGMERQAWRGISVPSSSGRSLQRAIPAPVIADGAISVPSSSGRSLQLARLCAGGVSGAVFQSPLHRGGLFNAPSQQP